MPATLDPPAETRDLLFEAAESPDAPAPAARPRVPTVADLLAGLGGVSPARVLAEPFPGTATVADVIRCGEQPVKRLVELVDGTLLEKVMGLPESLVSTELARLVMNHAVEKGRIGYASTGDGPVRLTAALVRLPDMAYFSKARLPGGRLPAGKVPAVVPNIAAEVLSEGNTPREIDRKLREYFQAGVELVWLVDPATRTVRVFETADKAVLLQAADTLTGGTVLPDFAVKVADLFAALPDGAGASDAPPV